MGVDPGVYGAFALINDDRIVRVSDMPRQSCAGTGSYDPAEILSLVRRVAILPHVMAWMERPHTRPGEGAERSCNFGLGLGYTEMALLACKIPYERVSPMAWMKAVGVHGKKKDPELRQRWRVFDEKFPDQRGLILGPRGGVRDGRLEAVLIAEALRRTKSMWRPLDKPAW